MTKNLITETDTPIHAVMKLSEGNPGATAVMMNCFGTAEKIDPDSKFGPLGVLMDLDNSGFRGSQIYQFYKNVCNNKILNMITLFRAQQYGFIKQSDLEDALKNNRMIDISDLLLKVQEKLPNFAKDRS